ncbi:hypothetical protein BDP81DRAFT_449481 [Colletotrichum phormii]|uniref:Uncharacterized protein n=1 Tax=Colletotrichum phormii TaxID=359342 RepID=A0AAJ0EF11_9PEZI|nr:uncharacterized protein BDP81DRAFT_449481 [Colletotrichum phormii]KAK1636443.1 hypothetical protein BDP81DRAFT_449481 [Colletotrichum phormii]
MNTIKMATRTYFTTYPHVWNDPRSRLTTPESIEESAGGGADDAPTPEQTKNMLRSAARAEAITKALFEQIYAPNTQSSTPPEVAAPGSKDSSATCTPTRPGCVDCNTNNGGTSFKDIDQEARTLAEYGIREPRVKSRRSRFLYDNPAEEPLLRNEPWIKRFSYLEDGIEASRGFQRRADIVGGLSNDGQISELALPSPALAPTASSRFEEELRRWSLGSAAHGDGYEHEREITSERHYCLFCHSGGDSEGEGSECSQSDDEMRRELEKVNWNIEQWVRGVSESGIDGETAPSSAAGGPAGGPAALAGRCGGVVAGAETGERREWRLEAEEDCCPWSVLVAALVLNLAGIIFLLAYIARGLLAEWQ